MSFRKAMLIVGFGAALFAAAWLAGCGSSERGETQTTTEQKQTTMGRTVQKARENVAALANPKVGLDPVCGMAISEETVVIASVDGKNYGLCSQDCAEKFKADPAKYLPHDHSTHDGHKH